MNDTALAAGFADVLAANAIDVLRRDERMLATDIRTMGASVRPRPGCLDGLAARAPLGAVITTGPMRKSKPAPRPLVRTIPERAAFDHMCDGSVLVHMHHRDFKKQYFVVPGGAVTDETAAKIKKDPRVIGQHDGLFPEHDRTWRMVAEPAVA